MRFFVVVMLMLSVYYPNKAHVSYPTFYDEANRIISYSKSAKQFCEQHKYNNAVFFLVDMRIHSGKKRFFVIDMHNDSIINSGLVAHGVCGILFSATASFSNAPGVGCSSLGKYKIANKYKGRFGTAYKLYGLDSSNSNAFSRNVVLHSYYEVPTTRFTRHVFVTARVVQWFRKHF